MLDFEFTVREEPRRIFTVQVDADRFAIGRARRRHGRTFARVVRSLARLEAPELGYRDLGGEG